MAVFTPVSEADARELLSHYDLGELISLTGISAGIENSNFFLNTTQGNFVLTLFEVLTFEQLPFYVELMFHLANHGVAVPMPQTRHDDKRLGMLNGKPCIIATRLPGQWVAAPTGQHCKIAAYTQARIHLAAKDFTIHQPNLRGLPWWEETVPKVLPFLNDAQRTLLENTLAEQIRLTQNGAYADLPSGPAHCDFFRDNVLFTGTETEPVMGGVIDFYFAGVDTWLFDVAVAVNDWCIDLKTGVLDPIRVHAWLRGYTKLRPFTTQEATLWPSVLQAAALRFWISRLNDFHFPREAQSLKPHDPMHFERILHERVHGVIEPLLEAN